MTGQPKLELVPGARADEAASPCINVCRMDERRGLCEGCFRTIDEIACWSGYAREDRLAVLARIEARRRAAG
jgi:predicted Fe-S protein YdhL (DUF1289 family)